ncbi:hypothetical protein NQT66_13110 [Cellulophaga baltica]|uniref:hypothetical protein n=1 Tax=Cellulophaga baltica TaxID=76594 RepID=UPI00214856F2|nr:hypothetical protein [Cellulophaga baltica]MCR1025755.1 hypothetical protein [Cellulophaga baltica]
MSTTIKNDPLKISQLIPCFKNKAAPKKNQQTIQQAVTANFTKGQLWHLFKIKFRQMTGKKFIESVESINNVSVLFHYFLKDEKFLTHPTVHANLSIPDFSKGLLIIGGYGAGKTVYMKVLEQCFMDLRYMRFKVISTNRVVQKFENCHTSFDRTYFFNQMNLGVNLFDDIGSERLARYFGDVNIMKEIFEVRYMQHKLTYGTVNYKIDAPKNVPAALESLGENYGSRFYDRIFEMFNIIEFKGKSMRK